MVDECWSSYLQRFIRGNPCLGITLLVFAVPAAASPSFIVAVSFSFLLGLLALELELG
jgi:hypothetical protein